MPIFGFRGELLSPGCGQPIELGATIVSGFTPRWGDQPALLEPMQRGKKRPRQHDIGALSQVIDSPRDAEPVQLLEAERAENKEIERALQERGLTRRHS